MNNIKTQLLLFLLLLPMECPRCSTHSHRSHEAFQSIYRNSPLQLTLGGKIRKMTNLYELALLEGEQSRHLPKRFGISYSDTFISTQQMRKDWEMVLLHIPMFYGIIEPVISIIYFQVWIHSLQGTKYHTIDWFLTSYDVFSKSMSAIKP